MSVPSWLASADSDSLHLPTNLISFSLLRKGYLVDHRGGAERSRQGLGGQTGSGGEPGMNLSDLQGPQLPLAATGALRGQMSRPGKRLQGPAEEGGRGRLGTLTFMHPASAPFSPLLVPSADSTSSQALGGHFFPKTCGCSRRESGVPQDWSIRVEHLEKGQTHGEWVGCSDLGTKFQAGHWTLGLGNLLSIK